MPEERQEVAPSGDLGLPSSALPPPAASSGPGHHHHRLPVQLFRFVLTGGLSAVVDFGVLVLLMHLGLPHTPAKAVSFVCGTTTAYLINRRWTFRAGPSRRRFFGVLILYGGTFLIQVGLFSLIFALLQDRLPLLLVQGIAFVIAQGVATTVNFIVQRAVIFKHRPSA